VKAVTLTVPPGKIYLDPASVIAIAEHKGGDGGLVKTQLWVTTQELPFNIVEDIETVRERLGWDKVRR
jgi:hypothetical protein